MVKVMDRNIKLVYKYMLTKEPIYLIDLLINNDAGMKLANKYFQNELRQECIDMILSAPFESHFKQNEYFVDKHVVKKTLPIPNGCFRRV